MLNHHFSNSIFDLFFTGHLWDKRDNRKLKYCYLHFWSPTVFVLQAKTWRDVLDTDDDDADWLLGGAKAEHTNWRGRNSLKARKEPTSGTSEICWARTRTVLKPATSPAVSVQARKHTGPLTGLGAGPVDLKFASLNTKVRSKYRC